MRGSGDLAIDHAPDLFHLLHQIDLGVKTSGGINDQDIDTAGNRGFAGVENDR